MKPGTTSTSSVYSALAPLHRPPSILWALRGRVVRGVREQSRAEGGDELAVGGENLPAVVAVVQDEQSTAPVLSDAHGLVELRATETATAESGDEHALLVELEHAVRAGIGDVDESVATGRDPVRRGEF